ncbi:MAG: SAF domain-containing protein [Frankia sp.]
MSSFAPENATAGRPGRASVPPAPRLATAPRRRISAGRVGLAAGLVALCGLVVTVAFGQAGHRKAVLAVARPVAAGTTITDADMRVVRVSAQGLSLLPASERAAVVGRIAAVDLAPGTTLSASEVTGTAIPGAGQALVGVLLKPGQLPGRPLVPGDRVQLVTNASSAGSTTAASSSSDGSSSDGGAGSAAGTTRTAAVVDVTPVAAAADGSRVIDLQVSAADAPTVEADAAAGRLGVVLLPRAG